ILAQFFGLLFEQQRNEDRGCQRQHDRADESPARLALQFVDSDVRIFNNSVSHAGAWWRWRQVFRTPTRRVLRPPSGTIRKQGFYQLRRSAHARDESPWQD